ncbi:MAG: zinc-dependent metalloprotease [Chloroflexota bacterium]|nr:zinc-dependent metalloprotease [Chloroflexota bacterium]
MANNWNNTSSSGAAGNNDKFGKLAAGLGLATAAAFGVAWANARTKAAQRNGPPTLIDWLRVREIALRLNPQDGTTVEWRTKWNTYYSQMVSRAVPLIEEYTHTAFPRNLNTVNAVSRIEWVDANIASFQQLFEPIERLNRDAVQRSSPVSQAVFGGVNQLLISGEMGLLLGYLARRVLGQYDLSLLGKEVVTTGRVYFVEPNISAICQALNVEGDEFRLWIALHETTHAFEFESHPWVRQHFNSILEKYFSYITDDLSNMRNNGGLSGFVQRVRNNSDQSGAWLERIMTPEQKNLFQELQALMSIVEGYSNHIMNAMGSKLMPNYEQIKERVERRQKERGIIDQIFMRITGLGLKMEQYRLGEIFVDAVVAKKGIDFANLMWDRPAYIPTMEEVKKPELWITRIELSQ